MGDDDDRHPGTQFVESLTNQLFTTHVERARRLVQDEQFRVFHESTRNDQPLLLTAAEVTPAFSTCLS